MRKAKRLYQEVQALQDMLQGDGFTRRDTRGHKGKLVDSYIVLRTSKTEYQARKTKYETNILGDSKCHRQIR